MDAGALQRFIAKCKLDPYTGCVMWVGGQTKGRGHNVPYGSFWFEGRRWFAHRWAAKYIHNLDIEGFDVDHCCPDRDHPHTLCVQHLQAITPAANRELQTKRKYLFLQKGIIRYRDWFGFEPEAMHIDTTAMVPFHPEPAWLTTGVQNVSTDCPF